MTAMFSAQDHDDLDRVLGATGGIPDPADLHALADDAVAQVRRWLAESRDHEADFAARQLAGALKEPGGLDFIVRFVDHVVRPEDPAIAARALRELAGRAPGFLPRPCAPSSASAAAPPRSCRASPSPRPAACCGAWSPT